MWERVQDERGQTVAHRYDCIVIGSGCSGSVGASRRAQVGNTLCVLERGQRWPRARVHAHAGASCCGRVLGQRYAPVRTRRVRRVDRMDVIHGSGLGGGSLHDVNVHICPPASIFEDHRWPEVIDLESLATYYEFAGDILTLRRSAPGRPRARRSRCASVMCNFRRLSRPEAAAISSPGVKAPCYLAAVR